MRAVLLLQPDVPLYSSDALPVNCSAKPGTPEFPPFQEHLDINFSSACPSGLPSPQPLRTHTNRHRFVFFNKEINATTRRYIPHELGVIPTSPPFVSAVTSSRNVHTPVSSSDLSAYPFPSIDRRVSGDVSQNIPPGAFNDSFTSLGGSSSYSSNPHVSPVQLVLLKPSRGRLRAGDILYWHNLSRNGEIPAVVDDERAKWTPDSMSPYAGR
ncbi:hypothetical protein Clacol_000775 [Clathrus columnatus]|uniref:Uncharacterized protein n=1 Tax=Clathrus columnatus TaxID=1419009 RepID=A0AAV4ZZJ3_9AGAM|nr:hypothetical protein Clacol_000775 [Clathrus columnatus]